MQQADKKEAANRYGAYTGMTIFLITGESIMSHDLQQQAIQLILASLPDKFLPLFGPPSQTASLLRNCLQLEQSILLLQGQQLAGLLGYYHHRHGFLNLPTSALSMPANKGAPSISCSQAFPVPSSMVLPPCEHHLSYKFQIYNLSYSKTASLQTKTYGYKNNSLPGNKSDGLLVYQKGVI